MVSKKTYCGKVSRETLVFFLVLFISLISVSCGEDSVKHDVSAFNKMLEENKTLKTASEVMLLYYAYLYPGAKIPKYTITEEKLPRHRTHVVMIMDNLNDDSVRSEKFIMLVKYEEEKWKILTMERNWRCYDGRGHIGWGTEPCS